MQNRTRRNVPANKRKVCPGRHTGGGVPAVLNRRISALTRCGPAPHIIGNAARIGALAVSHAPPLPAGGERSTCRAIAYGAVSSAVIPAERSESRDPCTPVSPLFLMPGYLGPGSAAHHFVLRC